MLKLSKDNRQKDKFMIVASQAVLLSSTPMKAQIQLKKTIPIQEALRKFDKAEN